MRIILLVILVPRYGFIGPSIAFVCSEVTIVAIWIIQLARLGFHAKLGDIIWRPLAAGIAMSLVLWTARQMPLLWQACVALLALVLYVIVLLALKTFSVEEAHQAREGLAFFSPFVASWSKKLKRGA